MLTLDTLLDIICTEAIEGDPEDVGRTSYEDSRKSSENDLPSFQYNLELIKTPEGRCYWAD